LALPVAGKNICIINGGTADSNNSLSIASTANQTAELRVTGGATYNIRSGYGWLQMFTSVNEARNLLSISGGSTINIGSAEIGRNYGGVGMSVVDVDGTGSTLNVTWGMNIPRAIQPAPAQLNVRNGGVANFNYPSGLIMNAAGTNDGILNIAGGTVNIYGDCTSTVATWISNGWLVANSVNYAYNAGTGYTTITGSAASLSWYGNVDTDWYNGKNLDPTCVPTRNNNFYWGLALPIADHNICIINGGTADSNDSLSIASTANQTAELRITGGATYNIRGGSGWLKMYISVNEARNLLSISGGSTINIGSAEIGRNYGGVGMSVVDVSGASTLNVTWGMNLPHATQPAPAQLNVRNGSVANFNYPSGLTMNAAGTNDGILNIAGGTVNIYGNCTSTVATWISNGWLVAYNGAGRVNYSYDSGTGYTVITSTAGRLAVVSWGDQVTEYCGTDEGFDTQGAIGRMMARFKGRGFTAIAWRAGFSDFEPNLLVVHTDAMEPTTRLALDKAETIGNFFNVLPYAKAAAEANGLEFWVWVPTVYSDGAPVSFPGQTGVFPFEMKWVADHPEQLTVSRSGAKHYGVREYAYSDGRANKVNEMKYIMQTWGIKNIIADMRTEAAQFQPPPDKADRFGFNQSIVDAMLSQYGINILTSPEFDVNSPLFSPTDPNVQKWHDLRGTYLTQFFRDLRSGMDTVDPNIKIATMIPGGDYIGPVLGNWRTDWRTWINEGIIDKLMLPVGLGGPIDSSGKGYLTDIHDSNTIFSMEVFREYANRSFYPEVRLLNGSGDWYHVATPPVGADGWQTWLYDDFDLAWYQRWQQWNQDIKDLGYIQYIKNDFDSWPVHSRGLGDNSWRIDLRCCPGLWSYIGDGNDTYPALQGVIKHGATGQAMRLTRDNSSNHPLTGEHWGQTDSVNANSPYFTTDNYMTDGTVTFEFWIYRPDNNGGVSAWVKGASNNVALYFQDGSPIYYLLNGSSWVASSVAWQLSTWQKCSIVVDIDNKRYSAYEGTNGENTICINISYPTTDYFKLLNFSPGGSNGSNTYIDDVLVKWVPATFYTPKYVNVYLQDDFETHAFDATIHNTDPNVGYAWLVSPSDQNSLFFTENSLSYGNGTKCLAVPKATSSAVVSSNDSNKLTLAAGNMITCDVDVFVESGKEAIFGLAKSSTDIAVASIYLDSARHVKVWSGSAWVDTGKTIVAGCWYHFQTTTDVSAGQYKVVYQQSGARPVVIGTYNWGSGTSAGNSVVFRISSSGTSSSVYYDNVEVRYGVQASSPNPVNGAMDVSITPTLSWTAGTGATSNDVYFGTNFSDVNTATHASTQFKGNQAGTSYAVGTLSMATTYYWRIDELGNGALVKGTVWSFTTIAAVPTFVAAGVVTSGTGAITPALPAGIATNDILLLFFETSNQAISVSNQNGGTWTEVANSPQGTGTAAGTTGARLTAFWSRYNGSQGAPTTSDSGNHQLGRMIAIRGAAASGNPWDITAGGVEAVSDASGSIPGATTTVDNCLIVTAIATSLPDLTSTARFSSWTSANLASITERTDNSVTAGNGGGLGVATGIKATAGAYGNTAVTLASSAYKGMMSIAIKP
jgi:hypothetical protein